MKSSDTGGVKPMQIAGRMVSERERCIGMTEEERAWRKQYLEDQVLSCREPVFVPELQRELTNPIRRLYKAPLDAMVPLFKPIFKENAYTMRLFTGRFIMLCFGISASLYYFKYNRNDWTKVKGWRVLESRPRIVPGDKGYPRLSERSKPSDYNQKGFDKVTLNL